MKRSNNFVNFIIFLFIFLFLFSFFEPRYLFSATTTSGGDTGSHYPTAVYLKEVLLPTGRIMGWMRGNYAGFPLFYHYFPFSFLLIVLFSYLIPMPIAFKMVTVLGVFLLPLCVYAAYKLLKYPFPIPILGAIFTLPFLFMEANSMWGGNIPSTLAGEFSYSISLALMVLFFGSSYRGIEDKNKIIFNALLVFLIGLTHGFTLVFTGVIALFFVFSRKFITNTIYLFKVFGLAGLLLSFWFIPFLAHLPYVTDYVTRWHIGSMLEVFPVILLPFVVLGMASFVLNLFDRRTAYFGYILAACAVLYYISPSIGMLDIRFIPIIQLFLMIWAATFLLVFLSEIKSAQLIPAMLFLAVILWVAPNVKFTKSWIKWNYEGVESKASWPLFKRINDYLSKNGKGRVVYEHSPAHNVFGTERAFENLPYFAKRDTLEGLYMQSSISSPFVFYIQSEVSKVCSGPFPQYKYTHLNPAAAVPHLKMFNVGQYIVRSPEAKKEAKATPGLKLEKSFDEYEIYAVSGADGRYVLPLSYEPVLFKTDNWKRDFFEWFRRADLLDVPLVYIKNPALSDLNRFPLRSENLLDLPRVPVEGRKPAITEQIGNEEISFTTNLIGQPHLIKISYHPNWQAEGADKIYLVSPSFMLVYPRQSHVRLYFGKSFCNYLGESLSILGVSILLLSGIIPLIHGRKT